MKRRKFSAEYKRETVEMSNNPDITVTQLATDLGLDPNLISRWRSKSNTGSSAHSRNTKNAYVEEIALLKRRLAAVEKEREFLKNSCDFNR